jgi:Kef-type K+ transport system membrane component KefB
MCIRIKMDIPTITYIISFGIVFLLFIIGLCIVCYQNHQKKKKIENSLLGNMEDKYARYTIDNSML